MCPLRQITKMFIGTQKHPAPNKIEFKLPDIWLRHAENQENQQKEKLIN
jgi:hypothetical protein